jgi:hypothetical protein
MHRLVKGAVSTGGGEIRNPTAFSLAVRPRSFEWVLRVSSRKTSSALE